MINSHVILMCLYYRCLIFHLKHSDTFLHRILKCHLVVKKVKVRVTSAVTTLMQMTYLYSVVGVESSTR